MKRCYKSVVKRNDCKIMKPKKTCNGCKANGSFCGLDKERSFFINTLGLKTYYPTKICPKPKTLKLYMTYLDKT